MPRLNFFLLVAALLCVSGCQARCLWDKFKGPIDCVKTNTTEACNLQEDCSWCTGTSWGTGCYPLKAAQMLPQRFFQCDKAEPAPDANADNTRSSPVRIATLTGNDVCDKKSEGDCIAPECVWCTSAAVGGGCYTPEQAKLLPSAIFKCKNAPATAAV